MHVTAVRVNPAIAIVASSVANPTVLETAAPHGFVSGDTVTVAGHIGSTPAVAGALLATVLDATHLSVPVNVTIAGTGGTVTRTIARLPLTLPEGKLRAGLDWVDGDVRDGLMLQFIAAATSKVEQDTGISLLLKTYDVFFDALCAGPMRLPWRPVSSVASLSWVDTAGAVTAIDAATYLLDPGSEVPQPARLTLLPPNLWPTDDLRLQPWVLRIVTGWPDVALIPPLLLHAVGLLTAHYATVGRDLVQLGHIVATTPLGYDDIIAPFQLVVLA